MATLTEAQDAYDRYDLRVGVIHSDVADVILRLEAEITAARAERIAAINDKLEEVAVELKKLEEGVYTTAQTGSGLVRAMKVK